jgi:hypothetical protein
MNGVNGIAFSKNGNVQLGKKMANQRFDDPEFDAEVRYAKANGLAMPVPIVKTVERNPRILSQRNRK